MIDDHELVMCGFCVFLSFICISAYQSLSHSPNCLSTSVSMSLSSLDQSLYVSLSSFSLPLSQSASLYISAYQSLYRNRCQCLSLSPCVCPLFIPLPDISLSSLSVSLLFSTPLSFKQSLSNLTSHPSPNAQDPSHYYNT